MTATQHDEKVQFAAPKRERARSFGSSALQIAVAASAAGAFVAFLNVPPALGLLGFVALALASILAARQRAGAVTPRAGTAAQSDAAALVRTLIEAIPDPIVTLDGRGDVVAFNARALAVAPALQIGQPISIALRKPAVNDAIRRAAATAAAQVATFSERVPIERWYEAHVVPTKAGGGATALLVTLHDLTALHRVEQMRADFVANASHELRTPLAALSGFIDTLLGPARDDAAARQRFLDIMQSQAKRMARLIEDLLSLSRLEVSPPVDPAARADLSSVLRQVLDALQPLATEREVAVAIAGAETPLWVVGDRDELFRVFENLVENALKYGASGKRVDISAKPGRGEIVVAVRDYGPGIAPDHLPRLTERFYRVSAEQSRAEGGTGLGLALVKHILNRHGGRLKIDSRIGEGSTFTVGLPVGSAPAPV